MEWNKFEFSVDGNLANFLTQRGKFISSGNNNNFSRANKTQKIQNDLHCVQITSSLLRKIK